MICAVLRKNEALATGALGSNGAGQGGDRGGPASGQFNKSGSGQPPSSPAPSSTPGPYQFQQQPPSVRLDRGTQQCVNGTPVVSQRCLMDVSVFVCI